MQQRPQVTDAAQASKEFLPDWQVVLINSIFATVKNNYIFSEKISEVAFKKMLTESFFKINSKLPMADKKIFCDEVNKALKEIDPHLSLQHDPDQIADHKKNQRIVDDPRQNNCARFALDGLEAPESWFKDLQMKNYGFAELDDKSSHILANTGYIKINDFIDPHWGKLGHLAEEKALHILKKMQGKNPIVIDLRDSHGGSPEMVEFMISFLLTEADKKKIKDGVYNTIYDRSTDKTKQYKVRPTHFALNVPIYVLTNENTFSAAEELAYDLQQLNKHILKDDRFCIVGQATRGGAHAMTGFPLMDSNSRQINSDYFLWVPTRVTRNPYTQTNWEDGSKKGVQPDIPLPKDRDALAVATGEVFAPSALEVGSKSSTAAINAAGIAIQASSAPTSSWIQQDKKETREILQVFWNECVLKSKQASIDSFKKYLKAMQVNHSPTFDHMDIEKIFKDASVNFERFCASIQQFPLRFIHAMNKAEKLVPPRELNELSHHINKKDLDDLIGYMHEEKISAAVSLRADAGNLDAPEIPQNKFSYAMHSVGKVFTGILALRMVQQGVISEANLKKPLDEDFLKTLPLTLQNHLRENRITLHQLMTHHSGLGDYLQNPEGYENAVAIALNAGKKPPKINQPEDLLKYAEAKAVVNHEKDGSYPKHYSNLGILLVGLAIKTAYEKKYGSYDYDEILRRYILDYAGIDCFSTKMPQDGQYNKKDKIAPHVPGSPAGGYWTTAKDLAKFGKWIYEKCMGDEKINSNRPKLKKLIEDYGQEFYNSDRQRVEHSGNTQTSCSEFSVSLTTGAVVAILSDQPPPTALDLREKIQQAVFSVPITPTPAASAFVVSPNSLSPKS